MGEIAQQSTPLRCSNYISCKVRRMPDMFEVSTIQQLKTSLTIHDISVLPFSAADPCLNCCYHSPSQNRLAFHCVLSHHSHTHAIHIAVAVAAVAVDIAVTRPGQRHGT